MPLTAADLSGKRRQKYGAKPVTVDNIRFASTKEAKRYGELKLLEKAGEIADLQLQCPFPLAVWQMDFSADLEEIGEYVADFTYHDIQKNERVVEDVKGFKTPLYRWKKKHVEAQYGIEIREV